TRGRQRGDQRPDEWTAALHHHGRQHDDARGQRDLQQQPEQKGGSDHRQTLMPWRRAVSTARLQPIDVARANVRPMTDPNGSAVKCSTTQAMAKPTRPSTALAMTAAVGLPPTRRCKISITLMRMIGNTANIPLPPGPMR